MKTYKTICLLILALSLALTLISCGASAYDIAVANGFEGTEEEWLESLSRKGESAYDIAVRNGFKGTEAEWLESLKEVKDGSSAFDIAKKHGYQGTEAEWLESLKGEDCINRVYENGDGALVIELVDGSIFTLTEDGALVNEADVVRSRTLPSAVSIVCKPTTTSTSAGSGFIYKLDKERGDAYIVTNNHVVRNGSAYCQQVFVYLYGNETFLNFVDYSGKLLHGYIGNPNYDTGAIAATVVGSSQQYDVAVLKISNCDALKKGSYAAVSVGDSNEVFAGQSVFALGNAAAWGLSVTDGVISVDSELITVASGDSTTTVDLRVMRTDAAINKGNSGGGLFDEAGSLVGLVGAKAATEYEDIGYAIPANAAIAVADAIIDQCDGDTVTSVKRALLGLSVSGTGGHAVWDSEKGHTVIVQTVTVELSDTTAVKKIVNGDVITHFSITRADTQRAPIEMDITRHFHLPDAMLTCRVGDTVTITFTHLGVENTETIVITSAMLTNLY